MSAPAARTARARNRMRHGWWLLSAFTVYVAAGNALHRWVYPLPSPDPATYPVAGDEFGSDLEGFQQRIVAVVDGRIVGELVVVPGAAGPPLHYHRHFAEEFHVRDGTLHLQVGDTVVRLGPGESYRVDPLVPHRPFNPGESAVIIGSDEPGIPQTFAACLVQLYPVLDEAGGLSLSVLLRMSVIDAICDTHVPAPRPVVVAMNLLLAPAARLLGHTNYDPQRSLHPPSAATAARAQ